MRVLYDRAILLLRRLFLVGFCVLILPGTVLQLLIAFVFSLLCMLLTAVASPFKSDVDSSVAKAFGFALVAVFFFALVIKVNVLTESLYADMAQQQRDDFSSNIVVVSASLTIAVALALVVTVLVALQQFAHAARTPIIKLRSTSGRPALTVDRGITWHLFLSHIWGTGQDQCATIKRQLSLLLPGASIFLDVDDLESIDALEEYIDASQAIMIFVSKGYFGSKNCLREARTTVEKSKPIALVYDPVRGGATLESIEEDECPVELKGIFKDRKVIEWHRIKVSHAPHVTRVTTKPEPMPRLRLRRTFRSSRSSSSPPSSSWLVRATRSSMAPPTLKVKPAWQLVKGRRRCTRTSTFPAKSPSCTSSSSSPCGSTPRPTTRAPQRWRRGCATACTTSA